MIGDKIKLLRTEFNLSQKELAQAISASASTIGMYEQKRRLPDVNTIIRLSSFFNVTTDYLLLDNSENSFSDDEMKWLKLYRDLSPNERLECMGYVKGYISCSKQLQQRLTLDSHNNSHTAQTKKHA